MSFLEILIYLGIISFLIPGLISKIKEIIADMDINPETDGSLADTLCLGGICQNRCNNMNGQEVKRTANMGLLGEDSNIYQAVDCGLDKVLKDLDIVDTLCGDGTTDCMDSDCCRPKQCETDTGETVVNKARYFSEAGLFSGVISDVVDDESLLALYTANPELRAEWSAKQERDGNCPYQQTVKLNTNCTGTQSGIGMDCRQDFCCVPKTCSTDWSDTRDWDSGGLGSRCPTGTGFQHPSDTPCDTCGQDECCYNESDFCSASTSSPPNDNDIVTPANSYRGLDTNMEYVPIDNSTLNLTEDGLAYLQKTNLIGVSPDAVANRAALDTAIMCSPGYNYGMCDGTSTDGIVCNSHDNNERECLAAGCGFQLGDHPRVNYEGCTVGGDGNNSSIFVGDCKNTCTGNVDVADGSIYFFEDHGNPVLQGNRVNSVYDRGLESKKSIDIDWPSGTETRICDSMNASGEYQEYEYSCMGGGSYFTVSNLANCNQTCRALYADGEGWGCGDDKIYDSDNDPTTATHDSFIEQCCVPKTCQNSSGGESVYCSPYQKLKTTGLPGAGEPINSGTCCEPKTCDDVIKNDPDVSSDYGKAWSDDPDPNKSPRKDTTDVCIDGGTFTDTNEVNNRYLAGRGNLGLSTNIALTDFDGYFGSDRTDIGCCVTQTCEAWATDHLTEGDNELQVRANAYCGTGFSFNNEMVASSAFDGSQPSTGNPCCVSEAEIICLPTDDMGTGIIGYDITFDVQQFDPMLFNIVASDGVYRPVNAGGPTINGCDVSNGWTPTDEGPHLRCIPSADGLHKLYSITGCLPPDPDSCTSTLVAEPHSVTQYDTVNCTKTSATDAGVTTGSCAVANDGVTCDYVAGEQSQCTTSAADLSAADGGSAAEEGGIKICQVPDPDTHPGVSMTDFTRGVGQNGLVNMTNFAHQLDIITCQNSSNKPCFTTCGGGGGYGEFTISGCDYQDMPDSFGEYVDDHYWATQSDTQSATLNSCSELRNTVFGVGTATEPYAFGVGTETDASNIKGNARYFTCKCPTGSSCGDEERQTRFKYIWDSNQDNFDADGAKQSNADRLENLAGVTNFPTDRVLTETNADPADSAINNRAICNPGYFPFHGPQHDYCKPCTDISDKSPSEWIPHSLCDNTLPTSGLLSMPTAAVGVHNLYEDDGGRYNYDYRYIQNGQEAASGDADNYTGSQSDRQTGKLSFATRKLENQVPQTRIRDFRGVPDFSVDYPGTQGNSLSIIKSYWNEYFKADLAGGVGGVGGLTVVGASGTSGPITDLNEITADNLATRGAIIMSNDQPVEICKDKYTTPEFVGTIGTCVPCHNDTDPNKMIPHLRDNARPICSLEANFVGIESNHLNIISADNEAGTPCGTTASGLSVPGCCESGFQWYDAGPTYRNKCIPNPATLVNDCSVIADEAECPKHMQSIATDQGPEMTLCEWSATTQQCGVTNHHPGTRITVPGPGEKMYIDGSNEIAVTDEREFVYRDACPGAGSLPLGTGIEWSWDGSFTSAVAAGTAQGGPFVPCRDAPPAGQTNGIMDDFSGPTTETDAERVTRTIYLAGMGVPTRLNRPATYLNKDDSGNTGGITFVTDKYNYNESPDTPHPDDNVWATKINEIGDGTVEHCVSECLGNTECDLIKHSANKCTLYNMQFTKEDDNSGSRRVAFGTSVERTYSYLFMPPQGGITSQTIADPIFSTGLDAAWIIGTEADGDKANDTTNGSTGRDWNIGGVYLLQQPEDFESESALNKDSSSRFSSCSPSCLTVGDLSTIFGTSYAVAHTSAQLVRNPAPRAYWKKIGAGSNPDLFLFYGNHGRWLISTKLTIWLGNTPNWQRTEYGASRYNPDSEVTIDKSRGFIVAYSDGGGTSGWFSPPTSGWHTLFYPTPEFTTPNVPTQEITMATTSTDMGGSCQYYQDDRCGETTINYHTVDHYFPTVSGNPTELTFTGVTFTNELTASTLLAGNWGIPTRAQGRNRELMNTIWTGSPDGVYQSPQERVQPHLGNTGITFSTPHDNYPAETWISMNKITDGGGGAPPPPPTWVMGGPVWSGQDGAGNDGSCTRACADIITHSQREFTCVDPDINSIEDFNNALHTLNVRRCNNNSEQVGMGQTSQVSMVYDDAGGNAPHCIWPGAGYQGVTYDCDYGPAGARTRQLCKCQPN